MSKQDVERWECSDCGHLTDKWDIRCPKCHKGHLYVVVKDVKPKKEKRDDD